MKTLAYRTFTKRHTLLLYFPRPKCLLKGIQQVYLSTPTTKTSATK